MGIRLFQRRATADAAASEFAATVSLPAPEPAATDAGVSDIPMDIGLDSAPDSAPGQAEVAPAAPTQSHIGRYALKHKLGEGGLGTVYEAWDPLLSRTVAVKTLQFELDTPTRVSLDGMFLNEARLAAGLSHPNIVTIFDAGLSAQGVYIAMERLQGRDLRQALRDGWRPRPLHAAVLVRRIADGLAYAHARGVVHCDVKPANIFLCRKDKPKLLDFGIARVVHGPGAAKLAALDGLVAGSPHYLAPEQLQGGTVDGRTDVYALGVVLYELLTGRKAFEGDTLEQITSAVLHNHPAPVSTLREEVPEALSAIVARAMARDPADRHADAAELVQDLRRWSEEPGIEAPPQVHAKRATPPRGRYAVPLALGALIVAGLGVAGLARRDDAPQAPVGEAAVPATATAPATALTPPAASEEPAAAPAETSAVPVEPRAAPAARPRNAGPRDARNAARVPAPPMVTGVVQLAISPWGEVVVDGKAAGTTPPLTRLTLTEGRHTITVHNADFPPSSFTVDVTADQPVTVKHRFGS